MIVISIIVIIIIIIIMFIVIIHRQNSETVASLASTLFFLAASCKSLKESQGFVQPNLLNWWSLGTLFLKLRETHLQRSKVQHLASSFWAQPSQHLITWSLPHFASQGTPRTLHRCELRAFPPRFWCPAYDPACWAYPRSVDLQHAGTFKRST